VFVRCLAHVSLAVVLLAAASCGGTPTAPTIPTAAIHYEVTGNGARVVTEYQWFDQNHSRHITGAGGDGQPIPMKLDWTAQKGDYFYLKVTLTSGDSLTATISVDGQVVKTGTVSGQTGQQIYIDDTFLASK
jgi:hypothetical protein